MYVARHSQITQNIKFDIFLQYLKKEVSDEVDFLHADKHESLLQLDTMILMGMAKHSQIFQNSKFEMPLQYLKKEVRYQVSFLHAGKYQVDFNTLGIKVFYKMILSLLMGMIQHSQSTQSNKFAKSLQYLKKRLGMELIFCMQINIKVSTNWHYRFQWKRPNISKVPKIGSW